MSGGLMTIMIDVHKNVTMQDALETIQAAAISEQGN